MCKQMVIIKSTQIIYTSCYLKLELFTKDYYLFEII